MKEFTKDDLNVLALKTLKKHGIKSPYYDVIPFLKKEGFIVRTLKIDKRTESACLVNPEMRQKIIVLNSQLIERLDYLETLNCGRYLVMYEYAKYLLSNEENYQNKTYIFDKKDPEALELAKYFLFPDLYELTRGN